MTMVPLPPPDPVPQPPAHLVTPRAQRVGATYFVGFLIAVAAVFLWLRGAGRFLIPLLLVGIVVYGFMRVAKKIREPLP
jgi:hypothetical protein